jgi:glycosyltransferase involved in cell wall biosynthesis
MKILLVHEHYHPAWPSGEDAMYRAEARLLAEAGHEVVRHEVHHDALAESRAARTAAALGATWSRRSARAIRAIAARERPDVAHFHNTFPLISPSAYAACQAVNVPVVQTLHNYRLICAGGLLMREGRPCEQCVGAGQWPALRHGCYRDSRAATGVVVTMLATNRALGTYRRDVDRYLALTEFARALFVRGGLPGDRVHVRPNGLADDPGAGQGGGGFALYIGRLSAEKGVSTLVEAWRRDAPLPLLVAGDGPLRAPLEQRAARHPSIRFLGAVPREQVLQLLRAADCLVMPSECYEGLPVTFMEALACGTPILASRIGALASLLTDGREGFHFRPADPADLTATVRRALADPSALGQIRRRNRARFEAEYAPAAALRSLERHYAEVVAARRTASGAERPTAAATRAPV